MEKDEDHWFLSDGLFLRALLLSFHNPVNSIGGVNESNILKFMELIEQRAVEIIADFTKKMSQQQQYQLTPVLRFV